MGDFKSAEIHLMEYERVFLPHGRAYHALIKQKVIVNSDLPGALFYWDQMVSKCKIPSIEIFSSIIAACSKAGHLKKAKQFYAECNVLHNVESRSIPSINIAATMLTVYGRELSISRMLDTHRKILKSVVGLDVANVLDAALCTGYLAAKQYQPIYDLWQKNFIPNPPNSSLNQNRIRALRNLFTDEDIASEVLNGPNQAFRG